MFKTITLGTVAALALTTSTVLAAGGGDQYIEDFAFSFEGPFGTFDQNQLQRGLKIYTEICASCHGLKYVPLRTLADEGGPHYSDAQVRAYAAENFEVFDAELDDYRPAKPTDHFPENNDAGAPDLSLMAKARAGFHGPYGTGISQFVNGMGGPEYIASLLTGYTGEEKEIMGYMCKKAIIRDEAHGQKFETIVWIAKDTNIKGAANWIGVTEGLVMEVNGNMVVKVKEIIKIDGFSFQINNFTMENFEQKLTSSHCI